MAQFNYEQYAAQQAARKTSSNTQNSDSARAEVHFFGEFMKNDGDVAVVRFPYRAMSEVMFETTHLVDYPGRKFKARVSCGGNDCPICSQGVKIDTRCFVKGLIYVADDSGKMTCYNAVWDRPSAYADIELKNLINEYGDLTQVLFKIRRTGAGTSTRYTTSIVLPNNSIYNDTTCPADFTELNSVDPSRILCKTVAQYNAALNPNAAAATAENTDAAQTVEGTNVPYVAPVREVPVQTVPAYITQPAQQATMPPATPSYAAPAAAPSAASAPQTEAPVRQQRKYAF